MAHQAWSVVGVLLVTVVTLAVGSLGMRRSHTLGDFYVASRSVTPRWNAAAVSGEYLSAASFLGIAGLLLTYGFDMLWYPVGYTAGYLILLALVAAPLRRSGAYTVPDFAQIRLGSVAVRRTASVLVVLIGWLYLVPQLQGAALTLSAQTGAPGWAGGLLVCIVVLINVAIGGMRSITFAQAVQYWMKLTALLVPAVVLGAVWHARHDRLPEAADGWLQPLGSGLEHPLYATLSLIVAICLGTMGLPHVLVRFYTNPDGREARRTALIVIGLLSVFYQLPTVFGVLGRRYLPELAGGRLADATVLLLPERMLPGLPGQLLGGLVTAGAFAAFLSTASGLTVSVAGVLAQDAGARHSRTSRINRFRGSALVSIALPYALSLTGARLGLAAVVGLAFALAASTFCPLLVLGIWWRGLTDVGALVGLLTGGLIAGSAVLITLVGPGRHGWPGVLLSQPAAWVVPLVFAVMIGGSLLTRSRIPPDVSRVLIRLHAPESMAADLPSLDRSAR
ncbi:cation/acetate symporter [Modestobacter sp. DSM 44400]|uniref:sodium/solute symporter n=1 Tax=Modestobacter sp. DSM 44400 TaxID=1550230 RepID=UPI000897B810|nr:cation acetate symporter [Modestobacter sp. DSM 44400]SDX58803.1 cation/acetate symporter [Modestobacter sp. DSM 44400]